MPLTDSRALNRDGAICLLSFNLLGLGHLAALYIRMTGSSPHQLVIETVRHLWY